MIFEGPKELLDETENTQPAIFGKLLDFEVIKNESAFNLDNAEYFAGHSLGEYSALACSKVMKFKMQYFTN